MSFLCPSPPYTGYQALAYFPNCITDLSILSLKPINPENFKVLSPSVNSPILHSPNRYAAFSALSVHSFTVYPCSPHFDRFEYYSCCYVKAKHNCVLDKINLSYPLRVVSHNDPNAQVVLLSPIENTLAELNPKPMQTRRAILNLASIPTKIYLFFPSFSFGLFLQIHRGQHGQQTQGTQKKMVTKVIMSKATYGIITKAYVIPKPISSI